MFLAFSLAVQDPKPFIVVPIPAPTHQASFADVVLGAVGLTGALVLASLVLAVIFAGVLVFWHRRHRPEQERMPPVSPLVVDSTRRESSQAR
jgi:hypothetical protein